MNINTVYMYTDDNYGAAIIVTSKYGARKVWHELRDTFDREYQGTFKSFWQEFDNYDWPEDAEYVRSFIRDETYISPYTLRQLRMEDKS